MKYLIGIMLIGLLVSCGDDINAHSSSKKNASEVFDTVDISNTFEYKYNPMIFDLNMKPLTAVINSKYGLMGTTLNGQREGLFRYFYDNGNLAFEAEYKNGKVNGFWKQYYESGSLMYETIMKNGTGINVTVNEKGDTIYIGHYNNGKLDGKIIRYYDDGQEMYSTLFKSGSGVDKRFYQNRNLKFEQTLKDGLEEGLYKEYYQDGRLRRIMTFKNGLQNGKTSYWDYSGELTRVIEYKNGIPINDN